MLDSSWLEVRQRSLCELNQDFGGEVIEETGRSKIKQLSRLKKKCLTVGFKLAESTNWNTDYNGNQEFREEKQNQNFWKLLHFLC